MRPVTFITLGFAPIIALIIYLYLLKKYEKSFMKLMIKSFLLGSLSLLLLLIAEYLSYIFELNGLRNLKRILFFSFVTIAFSSELGKFIILRYFIIPSAIIDRPIHAITMSVMTAMGFSTVAMIFFFLDSFNIRQPFPDTLYSFIYVPANIIFAMVMGFFLGMAGKGTSKLILPLTGLAGAVIFHGIFNFCLLTPDYKLLSLFAFGSTIIVFTLGIKASFTRTELSQ